MERRRFGRTELEIPAVTFGGGWVGGLLIRSAQDVAHAALDRALGAGIDWVDTAASYGDGVSETVIGGWLKTRATDARPRISTKFRVDPLAGDMAGQIRRSLEQSLERLGLSRVELFILHNTIVEANSANRDPRDTTVPEVIGDGGVAKILDQLRSEGLFDFTGITGLGDPAALATVVDSGAFDAAQIYANLLNPSAVRPVPANWNSTNFQELAKRCQAADMGVMGIRIFAAGHLATDVRHGREIPITANAGDAAEEARARAIQPALDGVEGTRAQTALRYGLALPDLSTVVVGIGEPDHFEQVLAAAEMGPLSTSEIERLSEVWETHAAFLG